jgi:putative transcriptional regulator
MKPRRKFRNRLLSLLLKKSSEEGRRIYQAELAEAIGVSENTISTWVSNDMRKMNINVIELLCEYFNCDVSDLFYLEPIENPPTDHTG